MTRKRAPQTRHTLRRNTMSIMKGFIDFMVRFNENYGSMGWLDGFHGTNKTYLKSIQAKRSFIIYGLTPATEIIPDDGNQKEK